MAIYYSVKGNFTLRTGITGEAVVSDKFEVMLTEDQAATKSGILRAVRSHLESTVVEYDPRIDPQLTIDDFEVCQQPYIPTLAALRLLRKAAAVELEETGPISPTLARESALKDGDTFFAVSWTDDVGYIFEVSFYPEDNRMVAVDGADLLFKESGAEDGDAPTRVTLLYKYEPTLAEIHEACRE